MFTLLTDNITSTKQLDKMNEMEMMQELSDNDKLEFAQQEIRDIRLEKIELQKEINHLKRENEELKQENYSYFESLQMNEQKLHIFRKVTSNINCINRYNDELNIQISEYEELIKKINSNNLNLQKENEKYVIILEELNEEKQKRDEININNTLNLENKIKALQNECDYLKEEINTICESPQQQKSSRALSPISTEFVYANKSDFFQRETISIIPSDKPLFYEYAESSSSEYGDYNDHDDIDDDIDDVIDDVIDQLIQFDQEINTAINKMDIENNKNCKCEQYDNEINSNMIEIDRLKLMNDDNKYIIQSLQKRIRKLNRENKVLTKKINSNWYNNFAVFR